ncbi:PREDICTED: zinc finger CCCH domain-containing protein 13-like isoform X1 [Rhagoletis zephyria]|uniref:zinc finger CCCH domain-containing protein 13-like isoform X1 n=1 Tax=Rhagoletis zephyria TaxID=28612 RepID=UPI0008114DB8|nr:PREDICTED: zinc finger CCCH domain-containing protein 13-like isoform X1 [Rhagoletis zephyria]
MSVHYKFKSALDFDTVTFDGLNISVGDLKRSIIHQKRLGKVTDFDLQITNAQTKEEYQDDTALIPKNTSLIIARIPITQPKKIWNPQNIEKPQQVRATSRGDGNSLDLSKMKGSEEDKILEMMIQSTADYDPKSYHRIRGHSQVGEVPPSYRCNRCKKTGHWIKNCPYTVGKEHSEVKRNTGIPRSFLDKDDNEPPADFPEPAVAIESKKEIPEDLICSICKDLFVDAVMIPCCGSSFCDDCVRSALLESEENECPDCKERGCSPGSLIPNRFLRNSVNAFKNENGYTNLRSKKVIVEKANDQGENTSTKEKVETADVKKPEEKQIEVSTTPKEISKSDETIKEKDVENSSKIEATKLEEIESDYEDNITIMMPPVPAKNTNAGTVEHSGRSVSHPKPPGIESSPRHKMQISPTDTHKRDTHFGSDSQSNEWDHDYKSARDYSEDDVNGNMFYKKQHSHPINPQLHYGPNKIQIRPLRPNHLMDVYSGPPNRVNAYQQMPVPHSIAQDPGVQGQPMMPFGVYNPMGPRPNIGYQHSVRPMFHNAPPGFPSIRCPPADMHHTNSNLASVYQGVAAKVGTGIIEDPLETFNRLMKEKERRREERRRSLERRRSWSHERQNRGRPHVSPYRRAPREVKEKLRPYDADRKRDNGFDRTKSIRRRRSNSFSDKSSRSRSWSNSPVKKRSRSPYNKRSRSRTHAFQEKQRDTGKIHNIREGDLLEESSTLRGTTSEERIRPLRQSNAEWHSHQGSFDSEKYSISRKDRFQEGQFESVEPPPPGYEPNQSSYINNYNTLPQDYINPTKRTERIASDTKDQRQFENRRSSDKNDTKNVSKTSDKKVRRTRSPTPVTKKRSDSCEKLEKTANKRSRNNIPTSRKSAERSKPKRVEANSSEAPKRCNEKRLKTPEHTPVKEVTVGRVKTEKWESFDRRTSPEKHRPRHPIVSKDEDVRSNSSKDEKSSKKSKDKDRKKRRKDKTERKKLKKDKRSRRERERQKNSEEPGDRSQHNENDETKDVYISRTPELTIDKNIPPAGDIASTEETKVDTSTSLTLCSDVDIKNTMKENSQDKAKADTNTTESEFKRVDSVLDILDYETEFDDLNSQSQQKQKSIAPVPEPSKWEIDEQNTSVASEIINLEPDENTDYQIEKLSCEKVTNEVLRKAENAIFARAIKAIYPFEKSDGINDHQRVYSETLPRIAVKDKIKNFEITVPTSNSQERSVQLKDDNSPSSPKVVKSVKERLGSKIISKYDYSPDRDRTNKELLMKINPIGRSAYERAEERNRNKFKDRDRDNRDSRTRHDNREKNVNHKLATISSRDRDRERNRDRDRDRDRYHDNDKYHDKDRERARDRDRDYLRESRNKSPKHVHREIDIASRSRPRVRDRDDDESSHTSLAHKRRANTPNLSKEQHKGKKRGLEERDEACSSNAGQLHKKRSISRERNKNETHESKKSLSESENRLKLHHSSACSSSGSADTSSDSESDEGKRKKKHKYKKDKKRSKRSLSAESAGSSKEKHTKNKKRNKSSKKKKKNKK